MKFCGIFPRFSFWGSGIWDAFTKNVIFVFSILNLHQIPVSITFGKDGYSIWGVGGGGGGAPFGHQEFGMGSIKCNFRSQHTYMYVLCLGQLRSVRVSVHAFTV